MSDKSKPKTGRQWSRFRSIVMFVLLGLTAVIFVAVVAFNSPQPEKLMLWVSFPFSSAIALWILKQFILDLIQYRREGWNFDERGTRANIRWGEDPGSGRPMHPSTQMWFGYPMAILVFGAISVAAGLALFGIIHVVE